MRPSQYKREMCMTTAERHRAFSDVHELNRLYAARRPYKAFTVIPHRIVFQQFDRCDTQEQQVIFRNDDSIPHLLRVMPSMSPYISVALVSAQGGKLAPGMFVAYRVTFRPEEQCDYHYQLECTSDQVTFAVPIEVVGPRAILDFPDRITFQSQPVQAETSKLLSVKNVGQKAAKFSLDVPRPFCVEPRCGTLAVDQVAQVTIGFQPSCLGQRSQQLVLNYDNGEKVTIEVTGCGVEMDVGLSSYTVRMDTTFIGLVSRRTFKLYNKSSIPAKFVWRSHEHAPVLHVHRAQSSEQAVSDGGWSADASLVASVSAGARVSLPSAAVRPDADTISESTFQHAIFSIEPLEGEVWPDSAVEMTAIFQPDSEGGSSCIAYCQVTGRASRLPIHLSGRGRGADVELSLDSLDIGAVFKNSVFNYEVVAVNRGDIPARLRPLTGDSEWSRHITFQPAELVLHPKDHHTLVLTLDAQIMGRLDERFSVQVSGATRPLTLALTGRVVPPTLEFDSALLDFGVVAFGFRKVLRCCLKNTSLVPVEFSLSVANDGHDPAIRQERLGMYLYQVVKKNVSTNPREFSLKPSKGVLQPQSSVAIKVELVPNTSRHLATQLLVDIDGVEEALYSVPLSAECTAPDVRLRAPDVLLGRHFKGCSADGAVTLVNASAVPARYFVLPQETMDFPGLTYSCDEPTAVLEPHSSATVPFTVQLQALGSLVLPIRLAVFGRSEPLQVMVRVVSQGPVIDLQPPSLDWGVIPVLTPHHKTVIISNQAPVPATMTATMQRSSNYWMIYPTEATVGAEQTLSVRLTAVLDDPLHFYDVLVVTVQDSGTWEIPVSAQGRGSSILFEPPVNSIVDMGPVFCKTPVKWTFTASNMGHRYHQLVWSNDGVVDQSMMSLANTPRTSAVKLGRRVTGQVPVFQVTPRRAEISPGESQSFTLEAYCESVSMKREEVSCIAMVGTSTGKTVLKRLVVAADFISPNIEFSRRQLNFERKQIPGVQCSEQMSESVVLTNHSPLALTAHIRTQYPFLLRSLSGGLAAELDFELGVSHCVTLEVLFDPDYEIGLTSRYICDKLVITYKEHPHCDEVMLTGIVSFPNLSVSATKVEFGCILNDMESFRKIKITNSSKVPVMFHWYFVDSDTELDWLPEADESSPADEELEELKCITPTENTLRETKVDKLITVPLEQIPVECHAATLEERLQSLRQRRQSRYLSLPPALGRVVAAQKLEATWKRQAAVNEIVDIYPMRGKLQPGANTSVVFKFYGHGSVRFAARAVCSVHGGPHYSVQVSGRASNIRYRLEQNHVECGGHIYCHFLETSTALHNIGQVEFHWKLDYEPEKGRLHVEPTEGVLQAGDTQLIAIHFLPMIPEHFERRMKLAVAHFPLEVITVTGHGAYPAVMVDLPLQYQHISDNIFLEAVQNISVVMEMDRRRHSSQSVLTPYVSDERVLAIEGAIASASPDGGQTAVLGPDQQQLAPLDSGSVDVLSPRPSSAGGEQLAADQQQALPPHPETAPSPGQQSSLPSDVRVQTATGEPLQSAPEVEPKAEDDPDGEVQFHLEIASDSIEAEEEHGPDPEQEQELCDSEDAELVTPPLSPSWSVISHGDPAIVDASLIDLEVERLVTVNFIRSNPTTASFLRGDSSRRNAVNLDLLKYYLDFGLVLLGSDLHRAITITNICQLPVAINLMSSIHAEGDDMTVTLESQTGILSPGESAFLNVRMRPGSLDQPVEMIQRMIYLEVKYGLYIPIMIKATVTMPIAEMDSGDLSFGTAYIGMCKICQIKVHNNGILPAVWSVVARTPDRPAALPFSSGERTRRPAAPAADRRPTSLPSVFTFKPAEGVLEPDEWAVADVIFAPSKSKSYVMEAVLTVQGSTRTWTKRMTGEGLDSALDVSTLELAFDPIIPYADGVDMQVTIFNQHPVPLEIYSLEFDRQYLEEEHMLRLLPNYSEFDTLILPPRRAGESLPAELRAYNTDLVRRASQPGKPADEPVTADVAKASHVSLDGTLAVAGTGRTHSRLVVTPGSHVATAAGSVALTTASTARTHSRLAVTPGSHVATAAGSVALTTAGAHAVASSSSQAVGSPGGGGVTDVLSAPESPVSDSSQLASWPGWPGVLDKPAIWTLDAQEQFVRDYQELAAREESSLPADPVSEAVCSYIARDQPPHMQLQLSRTAPAFVIISAPYTEPYLMAILLAERYRLTILTVDQLVWESVLQPKTAAAQRARDFLCDTSKPTGRAPAAAKQTAALKKGQSGARTVNGRRLVASSSSMSQMAVAELRDLLKPRPLTPVMLGELICARLLQVDVAGGVVFWDIHNSQFSANATNTVMALLLGLGKRKHAYFITLDKTAAEHRETTRKQDLRDECPDQHADGPVLTDAELLDCDEVEYEQLLEHDCRRLDCLLRHQRRQRCRERRDELRRLQEQLRQEHEKKSRKGKGGPGVHKQMSHHTKLTQSEQAESRKPSVRKTSAMSRSSIRRSDLSMDGHDKKRRLMSKKKGEDDVLDEQRLEEDKMITAQFKAYSDTLSSLVCLLDIVDRDRLVPEGLPADDILKFGSTAHKKSTKGRGQRAGKASQLSKRVTTVGELRVPSDLGVTHLLVTGSLDCTAAFLLLVDTDVLPTPSSVRDHMGMGTNGPPLTACRHFSLVKKPALRTLPQPAQTIFTFKLDEVERQALGESAAEKEDKAQRTTPEKSPPSKRRGQRRKTPRRRSDQSLAGDQRPAGSVGGECDTDLATAIRQALHRDDPVVSGHRWVVPAEGELTLTVHFDVNRPGRYHSRLQLESVGKQHRYTIDCYGSCVMPLVNRKINTLYARVPMRAEDIAEEHGVAFVRSTRTLSFGPLPVVKANQRPGRHNSTIGPPLPPQGHLAEITMENISPLPVEISFYLFNDTYKVPPFVIWPLSLSLEPGEKDYLQVVALPPSPQPFEDMLIGCVKDNPAPWITKVTCIGARPEVHLDKKLLTFDRVLLLRKETRKLTLMNKSLIPLRFRVTDVEQLGDGFTFRPRQGTLVPLGLSEIEVEFSPIRPCLYHNKKIKLEITEHVEEPLALDETSAGVGADATSTSDNSAATTPRSPRTTLGVLQAENITVSAEGFDVAVDLMFPKGLATGVDFGTVKVKEEAKQTFTIKNKGKYEIMYKAWLEDPDPPQKGVKPATHGFHINPDRGILHPHERPLVIQMLFSTDTECWIKKAQMLRVQILDFHRKEEGEVIALIPVCISVRALFCKYSVTPSEELHLGHFPVAVRKVGFFIIQNDGKFDFSYHIIRTNVDPHSDSPKEKSKKGRPSGGKGGESSSKSSSQEAGPAASAPGSAVGLPGRPTGGQNSKITQDAKAMKLAAGIYSLQPAMGTIGVGSHTVVNVEAISNEPISDTQELVVRISDAGDGVGIPFRLLGTVTSATIRDPDGGIVDVFEEHAVVDSLRDYDPADRPLASPFAGVYGRLENRFLISPTIVGDSASVAFRVQNTSMIPVDIVIAVKAPGQATKDRSSKAAAEVVKVFDVSPSRASIPVHGHQLVQVTFTPPGLQTFTNVMDIQIEETTGIDRTKGITFEMMGQGMLPRVEVLEPTEMNKQQESVVNFLSTRIGDSVTSTVRIQNPVAVCCMVDLMLPEGRDVFSVRPDEKTLLLTVNGQHGGMISDNGYMLGTLRLPAGGQATLFVTFYPTTVGACTGLLLLNVNFNSFQRQAIRINGHGYCSGVLLHGLQTQNYEPPPPIPTSTKSQKDVVPEPVNPISQDMPQLQYTLEFVARYVGVTYRRQCRLENCSDTCRYRFELHQTQYLTFSPAVGHLAPREIKTIAVSFLANEAINFEKISSAPIDIPTERKRGKAKPEPVKPEHVVTCLVTAIKCQDQPPPVDELQPPAAASWDDRSCTMQLVPVDPAAGDSSAEEQLEEECSRLLPEPEPAYEEVPPVPALRLSISAVLQTDLPKVKVARSSITFDDTFVLQSRTEEITLENVGMAELKYSWSVQFAPPVAPPVCSPTQVDSDQLRSQTSVVDTDSCAGFLRLVSGRVDELDGYVPFSVEPAAGVVAPSQTATCRIRFAPLDVLDYTANLMCSILHLADGVDAPVVSLQARGVLPVCHFDLEDTDRREHLDLDLDLDLATNCDLRLIVFRSVGVNRKITRSFNIINPTESSWNFTFVNMDDGDAALGDAWFSCTNLCGIVHSGQRSKVTFEYFPRSKGTSQSRWQFLVQERQLKLDLLAVGVAREPVVYPTQPLLRLPAVRTGLSSEGVVSLVNEEETPLRYQLDPDSCYSASLALRLTVQPTEGVIPAHGTATLGLQWSAQVDGKVEFGLRFSVATCHTSVSVTVVAEGYSLQAEAVLTEPDGRKRQLSDSAVNQLDLGSIPCGDVAYRTVEVANCGKFPFALEVENSTEGPPPHTTVIVPSQSELVQPLKRITCKFGVACSSKTKFSRIRILFKVTNGPVFALLVRGSAEPLNIVYSHSALDFGPCFLHQEGMPPILSELRVENKHRESVSMRVDHPDEPSFQVDFKQTIVEPSEKAVVVIRFVPSETKTYLQPLNIVINGQVHKTVRIRGEGIRFQVEVAHPHFKQLELDSFRVGRRLQKLVTVVNRASAPVACKFQLSCDSPSLQQLPTPGLRLRPAEAELRAHSSLVLELHAFSRARLPWFKEEVRLVALGLTTTLLTVEGTCQGMDLRLDVTTLPFGPVAAYSRVSRNVCLINDGDIGTRFRWNTERLLPEFSVRPVHGYSAPQSRVVCEISLQPKQLSSVIKKEGATCDVENFGSLPLTLTGACVPVAAVKEPLAFMTSVRSEDVRTIQIPNKTNTNWEVVPMVSGQFWRGPELIKIPAQSVGTYSVTYRPMVMTEPTAKHTGSVFLPLPDGQALLHTLVGISEPPQSESHLVTDIYCSADHLHTVQVCNWLTVSQRFLVKSEVIRSEKDKADVSSVQLKGLSYLDVPALATIPYTLTVYCFKEGTFHVKLTFRNERSSEYLFHDLTYRAAKTHERRPLNLHTEARQSVAHSVLLERPLESPLTCQVTCNMSELILGHHGTIHFPAGQEARLSFECLPLREGHIEAPMDVHSQEMGTYAFGLHVTASRPPLAGTVTLSCPLGQTVTRQVKFTNYSKTRAEYSTQLLPIDQLSEPHELPPSPESPTRRWRNSSKERDENKPKTFAELLSQIQAKGESKELVVDRSVYSAPGWPQGIESSFDLTFEPADVCSLDRSLLLTSPHGGEYRFAVHGTCTAPEPQGPFNIKAGSNIIILFKNVFPATTQFSYYVDSPYFYIQKTPETIRAKKDIRLTVSFDPSKGAAVEVSASRPVTGCLTVSGPALPHGHTPAWRYYLRGLPSDK